MPASQPTDSSHAIVIGGSLAGLLAARALAGHFGRVTLIERDAFPNGPEHRSGVPQARHLHVLLLKGKAILEGFFPGFEQELLDAGAIPADVGSEFLTVSIFGRVAPVETGQRLLLCSRYLIEWHVRRRLAALGNVQFLTRAEVAGLASSQAGRVGGVRIQGRGGQSVSETLPANLVVDCSGRGSPAADWLAGLGYPRPQASVVNSHLGYATRWYRRADAAPTLSGSAFKGAIVAVRPPDNPRGGALFPAEGGQWIVTLAGTAGQYPPTDEAGFVEFARQLADPAIYDAIRQAEPASPVYGYRRTENQWRHYERLSAWPAGFVVMGDAACCFNPVYGQGMTAAALGAALLDEQLAGAGGRFPPRFGMTFQRRLARRLQTPWLMATGEDFRWENTEGPRPGPAARLVQGYFDRVIRLALHNQTASRAFIQVAHLLQPPTSLFRPDVLLPALGSNRQRLANPRSG
jgi:2-polyprenyl-6-methoxyphenol hydroxylase-like FAD-dependent oxidoreductase